MKAWIGEGECEFSREVLMGVVVEVVEVVEFVGEGLRVGVVVVEEWCLGFMKII